MGVAKVVVGERGATSCADNCVFNVGEARPRGVDPFRGGDKSAPPVGPPIIGELIGDENGAGDNGANKPPVEGHPFKKQKNTHVKKIIKMKIIIIIIIRIIIIKSEKDV